MLETAQEYGLAVILLAAAALAGLLVRRPAPVPADCESSG